VWLGADGRPAVLPDDVREALVRSLGTEAAVE
jgi:hypothetical protein